MHGMDIRALVGANIRRIRLLQGLGQEALATDADIAPSFLSQIENGKRGPTIVTIDAVAKALDVPVVDLFAEPQEEPKGLPRGIRT